MDSTSHPHADRFRLIAQQAQVAPPSFAEEVHRGLSAASRSLPCRFFYDAAGSKIFEEICDLEEYYLTRVERSILREHARNIGERFGEDIELVELGSGSAEKTRLLIEALLAQQQSLVYVPIDISRGALEECSESLLRDHPQLEVHAICSEYEAALAILSEQRTAPRLILWLGSSIGNLHKHEAEDFLAQICARMGEADRMLIGIDLRKDRERLERAYDDSKGVTARFNLNLLVRINRELGGNFQPEQFEFRAQYLEGTGAVESSLVSLRDQEVAIDALESSFSFKRGEAIHTENSYKYSVDEIEALADGAKMVCETRWLDPESLYSLNLFAPSH